MQPYFLLCLLQYRQQAYVGKPPCVATLKRQIDRGLLPGERRGTRYFVHVDENGHAIRRAQTGDAAADVLLGQWLASRAA